MADFSVKHIIRIIPAAVIALMMIFFCNAQAFAASSVECEYISGTNVDSNDYQTWSHPVRSYLVKNGTGYMRVQQSDDGKIMVAYYDSGFNVTSRKTITGGLPLFGGFYASGDYYYLVTGQNNLNESNNVEVYRITKFNRNWVSQGYCSLKGENTYEPFAYGSCRMAMDGNYLLIRTCHTMYKDSNNVHHQANVTIEVNTSNMQVTDKYTKVWNVGGGYVSHSFNQFIAIDGSHHIVAVDHGDASPRSICLMRYNTTNVTTGTFSTDTGVTSTDVFSFAGDYNTNKNTTGASVGAFELIGSKYLIAGNSVARFNNTVSGSTRNIFILSTDGGRKWLTDYAEGEETVSTPHMVRITSSKFMVLWTRGETVYYTFIDNNGTRQGSIYSVAGHLSDCAPIYDSGNVIWYTSDDGDENFYRIPVSTPSNAEVIHRTYGHDYQCVSAENGLAKVRCSKCGDTQTAEVPVGVSVFWRTSSSEESYYTGSSTVHVPFGDTVDYMTHIEYRDGYDSSGMILSDLEFTCDDPSGFSADQKNERLSFSKPGKYTVTVGPKYDPSLREEYTFYVYTPLKSVSLQARPAGGQKAGEEAIIAAVPDGGGYIRYDFEITEPSGEVKTHSQYDFRGIAFTAYTPGTYTFKVTATNLSGTDNESVTSEPFTYVISPSDAASGSGTGDSQAHTDGAEITGTGDSQAHTDGAEITGVSSDAGSEATAAGTVHKVSGSTLKVLTNATGSSAGTVAFTKARNVKKVTVPAAVSINGRTFKVTQVNAKAFTGKKIRTVTIGKNVKVIRKNAFKGSKATKIILKTKLLKKAKVKGCLKGSKVKTIQAKVGKKSVNKKYVKKYKKIFTKKNAGKKASVK